MGDARLVDGERGPVADRPGQLAIDEGVAEEAGDPQPVGVPLREDGRDDPEPEPDREDRPEGPCRPGP